MATVDLDALAAELTAAGMECKIEDDSVFADTPKKRNQVQRRWRVNSFGDVFQGQFNWGEWVPTGLVLVSDWKYLDIIRRHVSPEPSRRAAVDVDAVMKLIDAFGVHCVNAVVSKSAEAEAGKTYAAIRAMLEPHDAARMRETIAEGVRDIINHYAKQVRWGDDDDRASFCDDMECDIADAVIRAIGGAR